MENHESGVPENPTPIMPGILSALQYLGLSKHPSKSSNITNIVIHTGFVISQLSCMIPQFILVFSDKYNIFDKSEALAIILPMIRCMFKVLNRIFTMGRFWNLYDDIQRINTINARDPAKKRVLDKGAKSAHRLYKYFMSFYILLFIVFNVVPLVLAAVFSAIGYPSGLQLQFKAEYFYDSSKNPAFAIIYTVQAVAAFATVYPAIWDSVLLSSLIHVLAQVEIVTDEFKTLSENSFTDDYIYNHQPILSIYRRQINSDEEDRAIEALKRCIKNHITVIALVNKLEAVFSAQMGMECFVAASLTCLSMFQVTYSPDMNSKCKYFCLASFFYAGFYVQIHHGQKLLNESSRLERAMYDVAWTMRSPRYRKLVLQALQRAQRPLCITAIQYYIVSSETSLTVMVWLADAARRESLVAAVAAIAACTAASATAALYQLHAQLRRLLRDLFHGIWCGWRMRRGESHCWRWQPLLLALQRPLCINFMHSYAGVSFETFLTLLKATFSYFALLQTVAEE